MSLSVILGNETPSWHRIDEYTKENRPIHPVERIVVKGSVDVVFRRHETPVMIVAGETAEAVGSVKTYFKDGKLVIDREGMVLISGGVAGRRIVINGSVSGPIAAGDIIDGQPQSVSASLGRVLVAVGLPVAPSIKIKGSSDVTLHDVRQGELELAIIGSGDIKAFGNVGQVRIKITGSGDVDARGLLANRAELVVEGSGDIEAYVRTEVVARVAGSGDIVVHGNPARRDDCVTGSGSIRFR